MKHPTMKDPWRSVISVITMALALSVLGTSCGQRPASGSKAEAAQPQPTSSPCPPTDVDADTAEARLKSGNLRWKGTMQTRDWAAARMATALCQRPFAVVVSCMDSRVPPELIFDQGLGDIFIIRVAGPVLDRDQLASLEYALTKLNVKLVLVLGHTDCGAIHGAVAGERGTYLPGLFVKLEPAITYVSRNYNGGRPISPLDATNLNRVSIANGRGVANDIIPKFPQPGVKVSWGLYDTASGSVTFTPAEPWLSSQ